MASQFILPRKCTFVARIFKSVLQGQNHVSCDTLLGRNICLCLGSLGSLGSIVHWEKSARTPVQLTQLYKWAHSIQANHTTQAHSKKLQVHLPPFILVHKILRKMLRWIQQQWGYLWAPTMVTITENNAVNKRQSWLDSLNSVRGSLGASWWNYNRMKFPKKIQQNAISRIILRWYSKEGNILIIRL